MRMVAKWVSQLFLIVAAVLSGDYSLTDMLGLVQRNGMVSCLGYSLGQKSHVELTIRIVISVFALGIVAATDLWDLYFPRRALRDFRTQYLQIESPKWRTKIGAPDVRISILYAKRAWYWPFWRVFDWVWNDGFVPPDGHHDVNVLLACWQGISGQAFRSRRPKSVYIDSNRKLSFSESWLLKNDFRMTHHQLSTTKNVKAMISMPLLQAGHGRSPSFKAVGVINLDAVTDSGSELLRTNEQNLVNYFGDAGKLLGALDL